MSLAGLGVNATGLGAATLLQSRLGPKGGSAGSTFLPVNTPLCARLANSKFD